MPPLVSRMHLQNEAGPRASPAYRVESVEAVEAVRYPLRGAPDP
jgi:hypothetical protein